MELSYFFKCIDELSYKDVFDNCVYPQDVLNKLSDYVKEKVKEMRTNNGEVSNFTFINGEYYIGGNTKIGANVTIEGPVYIGKNVTIMPGALIRPYTLIGDNVVVGHSCEVKHSIVMNGAKVQSFTFIGDSIIGNKTRIGSGTILANRRFDQGNVLFKCDDDCVDLGTDFFGGVVGDNTRLGANVTMYPGTFVGMNTWIYPGTVVKGFIPSLKRVSMKNDYFITPNKEYILK